METTELKQTAVTPELGGAADKMPAPVKKKKKRKWLKRLIIIGVIVAILAVLFSRCVAGGQQIISSAFLSAQSVRQDLTVAVSGTGTIEPIHAYRVSTLVRGEVLEAPFEEGDVVQEGDLLFRLDAKDVETTIQQQELNLKNAQLSYDNLLKNQQVKATVSGVVEKLYVEVGDSVTMGAPIADILDRGTMKLTVPFHSSEAAGLYVGQSAVVTVGGTLETISGTVDSISATDSVGPGGTLVRNVTVRVANPGVLTNTSTGSVTVGGTACAGSGTFAYNASAQVIAKSGGEIKSLNVKEGDKVSNGQVLCAFDSEGLESARLSIESAQLALQSARDTLDNYRITSTITGTVIEKNVDVGDNIDATAAGAGTSITYPAVIYDMSSLTFEMKIHELDINKIKVGQRVEITASALEGQVFTGVVDKVNINGSTVNGVTTYPVTVAVEGGGELLPGMNVSAKILVEEVKNALCIPVEAVSRGNVIMVAKEGCIDETGAVVDISKMEERTVTLGRNNDEYIEVLEGLEEGEYILISNQSSNIMDMIG